VGCSVYVVYGIHVQLFPYREGGNFYPTAGAPGTRAYGEGEGHISSGGGWGGDGRGVGTFGGGWGGLAAMNLSESHRISQNV
jgi:hypothetical protein